MKRILVSLSCMAVIAVGLAYATIGPPATRLGSQLSEQNRLTVLVLGDQGSNQIRQWRVASAMENVVAKLGGASFVLLAGDNFYSGGVESIDDLQWHYAFENVYRGEYLRGIPFYPVLGNHDIQGNVDALIRYGKMRLGSNRWRMESRHYYKDFGYTPDCIGAPLIRVVFLDTTKTATSLTHEAEFIRSSLAHSAALWRVVIGHHPVRNYGAHGESDEMFASILPVLKEMDIDFYVSGHDHNQQVIHREGEPVFLISGAGGKRPMPVNTDGEYLLGSSEENGFSVLSIDSNEIRIELFGLEISPLQEFSLKNQRPSRCEV